MTVALGLVAALAWGLSELSFVRASRGLPTVTLMLWEGVVSILAALPLALLEPPPGAGAGRALLFAGLGGTLYLGGIGAFIRAARVGSLSIVAPIVGLEGGVAAVIGVATGDRVGVFLAAGLVLGAAGSSLASAVPGGGRSDGVGWAVASAGMFGCSFALYGAAGALGPAQVVAGGRAASLVVLVLAVLAVRAPAGRLRPPRRHAGDVAVVGCLDAIAFVAFAAAAARGPLGVAAVTGAQFAAVATVVGIVVLRERPAGRQYLGIALTLLGVTVLGLAG